MGGTGVHGWTCGWEKKKRGKGGSEATNEKQGMTKFGNIPLFIFFGRQLTF